MHLDEAQIGEWAGGHLGPLTRLIDGLGRSLLQIARKGGDQALGLADDHVVSFEFGDRNTAGDGSADNGAQAARAAALDDGHERVSLNVHAAEHDNVGPIQVAIAQVLDVGVNQPLLPGRRQQCRYCH